MDSPEDHLGRQTFLDEVHDPERASAPHIPSLPSLTGAPGVLQLALYESRFQVRSIVTRCVGGGGLRNGCRQLTTTEKYHRVPGFSDATSC